jgi:predicted nucleic acid-binding protein
VEESIVVVVDSSKLNQLARFCVSKRGIIKTVFLSGKAKGYKFVATTTNVRRALQSFMQELKEGGKGEEVKKVARFYVSEINILLDRIVPKNYYLQEIRTADLILQDSDREKEDSQALSLAITLVKEGFETWLWTNDKDFLDKAQQIYQETGVKVVKLLQ